MLCVAGVKGECCIVWVARGLNYFGGRVVNEVELQKRVCDDWGTSHLWNTEKGTGEGV